MKRRILDFAAIVVFLITAYWSWFLASLIAEAVGGVR